MEFTHLSVLWMKWRHFLSQIQRPDSDNNVPGLTPSYKNRHTESFKGIIHFYFKNWLWTWYLLNCWWDCILLTWCHLTSNVITSYFLISNPPEKKWYWRWVNIFYKYWCTVACAAIFGALFLMDQASKGDAFVPKTVTSTLANMWHIRKNSVAFKFRTFPRQDTGHNAIVKEHKLT